MISALFKKVISGFVSAVFAAGIVLAAAPAMQVGAAAGDTFTYDFTVGGSQYVRDMIEREYGAEYVLLYQDMVDQLAAQTLSDKDFGSSVDITYNVGDGILPSDANNTKLKNLAMLAMYDEPQLYWLDGYGISWSSRFYKLMFSPEAAYKSASARSAANNVIVSTLSEYHELLEGKKGTFFKLAALNDALADATKYDLNVKNSDRYNILGCFRDNLCVCDGYAKSFELISNVEGIADTVRVFNSTHAWNAVSFNDSWYYIDVTFDDVIVNNVDYPNSEYWRRFFLKSVADFDAQDSKHLNPDRLYSTFDRPDISPVSYVYKESINTKVPDGFDKGSCSYDIKRTDSGYSNTKTVSLNDWTLDFTGVSDGTYQMTFYSANTVPFDIETEVKYGAPTQPLEIKLNLIGDPNGDGKVNASDLLMVKSDIKGVSKLDGYSRKCADITGDNKLNASDLLRIKAHIKGVSSLWE
ncbi:MAG: hypothetical protein IJ571_08335 [Ruminococcus sp.]|nr:hypothetical protein [Ruminococcus sp.]